jgi:predicted transcriptional regulator
MRAERYLDCTSGLRQTVRIVEVQVDAVTTSIRMPRQVRDQFETLAQATGRTRNDLMVDALRTSATQQLREIAMIQGGLQQARGSRSITIEEVVAEFRRDGLLPADFSLDPGEEESVPAPSFA